MNTSKEKILAVPTNVITGFLGVGKTSAIMHLLASKPEHERWAILVNEFGEIGVDGNLISGLGVKSNGVFITEVPGGCMCCASGLPMQIALNKLLSDARPHRLLIEPTGLGHPIEVLQLLSNQYYKDILSLEKTLTLVDARNLNDSRYSEHNTFNQQLAIADLIIGNKTDLYEQGDQDCLLNYVKDRGFQPEKVLFTEHGMLEFNWLYGATQYNLEKAHHHHHHTASDKTLAADLPFPSSGIVKAENAGEGYKSIGWRFAPNKIFSRSKVISFITSIKTLRVKAVFITSDGIFGYNGTSDGVKEYELDEAKESSIEIISDVIDQGWEETLQESLE